MRCLVTGATGFIGSHLSRFLLQDGHTVCILIRPQSNTWRINDILPSVNVIYTDLANIKLVSTEIVDFKPDAVFHLAWWGGNSSKYNNDPRQAFDNIQPSLQLVQLAKDAGAHQWIGFGSCMEYGRYGMPLNEEVIPQPTTLYGISKYCVYLLSKKLCQLNGTRFVWIRPFWLYGPYDDPWRMIPYVVIRLLHQEKPRLTPGNQLWDYLYIEDAIKCIVQLATSESEGVFNLGSGQVHTIKSIVEQIRNLIDPYLPLGLGEVNYPPDQIMLLQADISRLRQTIGWSPHTSLTDGLTQTVQWYRKNLHLYEHSK